MLFLQAGMEWVQLKSICNMMAISFMCFGNFARGKTLWKASLTLVWIVWRERNARIFEDACKMPEIMWDLIHFCAFFWAYCVDVFKIFSLSAI